MARTRLPAAVTVKGREGLCATLKKSRPLSNSTCRAPGISVKRISVSESSVTSDPSGSVIVVRWPVSVWNACTDCSRSPIRNWVKVAEPMQTTNKIESTDAKNHQRPGVDRTDSGMADSPRSDFPVPETNQDTPATQQE